MGKTVLAIGLDSAEPVMLQKYLSEGALPNLKRLRDQGGYALLNYSDLFNAELPWTAFILGSRPQEVGYWDFFHYREDRYRMETRAAYEYDERKPFWALGQDYRVCVVDVPQARIVDDVNGVQVMAWGAHSPQCPTESSPPGLLDELHRKHGESPALHKDYGQSLRLQDLERVRRLLQVNARRRTAICKDLLGREDWDLFLTVYSEPHASGHGGWQVSSPDHPLYDTLHPRVQGNPLRESYEACDRALGELLETVDPETPVVVFSVHGMGPNTKDLPNGIFLPELLYRWNFPGHKAIRGKLGHPLPPIYTQCESFPLEVWLSKYDTNPLRREVLPRIPWGAYSRMEKYLGSGDLGLGDGSDLVSPFELGRETRVVPWMGSHWYRPLWPRMKAFCLPTFSDGAVRINVRGRDGHGIVDPQDYHRVCDEVTALLHTMVDSRRGIPMVKSVLRMREDPLDDDRTLPSADLIVVWQEEYAADSVESPGYGRIGPLPHYRAGSHLSQGFALIRHPQVAAGSTMPTGNVMDLAPTLLSMLGAPMQPHFAGQSLVPGAVAAS